MKRFFKYTFLALTLSLGFVSCNDDDNDEPVVEQLTVNYANIAGHWQLTSYNGHQLEEGTYLYITFERRDHTFQMYDNLESMYGQKRTGTYLLEEDDKTETMVLSGYYDNGVGPWDNDYTVVLLTADELRLSTVVTARPEASPVGEIQVYKRVESLPENIVSE